MSATRSASAPSALPHINSWGGQPVLDLALHRNGKVPLREWSPFLETPALQVSPAPGQGLQLGGLNPLSRTGEALYLALDGCFDGQENGILSFEFIAGEDNAPAFSVRIGLFPRLPARITIPLDVLNGQTRYLERTPGRLKAVCDGRRLSRSEVKAIFLKLESPGTLWVGRGALLRSEPPYPVPQVPVVDEFGQWRQHDWPGKIPNSGILRRQLQADHEDARSAAYPAGWNSWGGATSTSSDPSSQFFRVGTLNGVHTLIDPSGSPFWSAGVNCVGPNVPSTLVPGTRGLYTSLPGDPVFEPAHIREDERLLAFDFGIANLIRVWGEDWRSHWTEMTSARLRQWRFNTIGNWSDLDFARQSRLPFVYPMSGFPATRTQLFRDFPDVFSPEYEIACVKWAGQLAPLAQEPALIGYFIANEPQWAQGSFNLAAEMLERNPGTGTRRALSAWLLRRYGSEARWSQMWGPIFGRSFQSLAELESGVFRRIDTASPQAKQDLWEFSKEMVQRLWQVASLTARRAAPNHLNLGPRYAWLASELCFPGSEYFDVFSLNCYAMQPPSAEAAAMMARSRKPTLVGEFHFGATDRGLPASGLRRVPSQAERGIAYRRYVELAAADPNILGVHYFMLADQAVLGRFDGENYQIGLVDCCHTPYQEVVEAIRQSHERIYDLRFRGAKPFDQKAKELPGIY